jgi:anti-sigma regulatory factor (Ser/Thr protein kinase)
MITTRIRNGSERIRDYILRNVHRFPKDIGRRTATEFGITRQAAHLHLKRLVDEGSLVAEGITAARVYKLCAIAEQTKSYPLAGLEEDVVWRNDVAPFLGSLPKNVLDIWHYGFTEMLNNAIDHSGGTQVTVNMIKTAADVQIGIMDDGVGIFRKIQKALGLLDERHSVLELAKGKLTTDPARHTGEGIFFSSRMFDHFAILSGETYFSHKFLDDKDWILETKGPDTGIYTYVQMKLWNHTSRTPKKIFAKFTIGDELAFAKTVVPVRLAQYGDEALVSRSQAKRLLARVEKFAVVMLDFEGVSTIGQAFADEVFRVFPTEHPGTELHPINANTAVGEMVRRALGGSRGRS